MTEDTPLTFQDGSLRSISREELATLPIRRYEGEVRFIATAADAEHARAEFNRESVVGLDTETRPAFRKGESHLPCLVQVATERTVYLFQLRRAESHEVLKALLEDARIVKAGVALAHDLRALNAVFAFEPRNVLDLGTVARRARCGQTGLRNLAGMFLDFRIPKGTRTSNWAAPQLTPQQVTYAATDAWACRELFLRFETLGLIEA
jgi:ribonuclease D